MKLQVEFSVFAPANYSLGTVNGILDLEVVPRVGELVVFGFPEKNVEPPELQRFVRQLKVEQVLHMPQASLTVILSLSPVVLPTIEEGKAFFSFMEQGFGLLTDFHHESDL